jgi:hypothetical protein
MLLLAIAAAAAHGTGFTAAAVSVDRADPDELWVLTLEWGLAHTTDGGDTWAWHCEESVGSSNLYGVLATGPGTAVIATREGVRAIDADCGSALVPGIPADTFVPGIAAYGDGYLAFTAGTDAGGVWSCDDDGCVASDLAAPGMFPKSARADGDRVWATVVYEDGLASELWRSDDGLAWTSVYGWPDGDTDPRVLWADGDHLLVWRRTRDEADTPELLSSDDGGVTFTSTFSTGYFTDSAPALLVLAGGATMLLGSDQGARTWRSDDRGATWVEVSADVPAVRCADVVDGVGWACGDHLQDGFDVSRTADGGTWTPVACLETALPAACADATCAPLVDAYATAGSYGGGHCDTIITPPGDDPPPDDTGACGCGGDGSAAAAWLLVLAGWRRRGRSGRTA